MALSLDPHSGRDRSGEGVYERDADAGGRLVRGETRMRTRVTNIRQQAADLEGGTWRRV